MGISIWKLKINCPKCGKEYLYSDIEAGMLMDSTRDSIRGWRFSKLPNPTSCFFMILGSKSYEFPIVAHVISIGYISNRWV